MDNETFHLGLAALVTYIAILGAWTDYKVRKIDRYLRGNPDPDYEN